MAKARAKSVKLSLENRKALEKEIFKLKKSITSKLETTKKRGLTSSFSRGSRKSVNAITKVKLQQMSGLQLKRTLQKLENINLRKSTSYKTAQQIKTASKVIKEKFSKTSADVIKDLKKMVREDKKASGNKVSERGQDWYDLYKKSMELFDLSGQATIEYKYVLMDVIRENVEKGNNNEAIEKITEKFRDIVGNGNLTKEQIDEALQKFINEATKI